MEALGRIELPTNGLGNVGKGLHLSRIKHLNGGFGCLSREKSCPSALNCQHICQREIGIVGCFREAGILGASCATSARCRLLAHVDCFRIGDQRRMPVTRRYGCVIPTAN